MSKIGIITYHNNRNRGSILQAYSLYQYMDENNIGEEIEIVDYRLISEELKRLWSPHPIKLFYKLPDYFTFENFFSSYGALSKNKIVTNNHEKGINFLKNQNYDMLIVGSDTIWRLEHGKLSRPFPNAYFLDPKLDCFKATYAASCSNTDYENLSERKIKLLKKHISSIDKISVRDKHTENFLKKLDINDFSRVPDPTILVDMPNKDLTDVLINNGISPDKPILAMNQCGNLARNIANYYREKDYQIVSLYKSDYSDFDLNNKINPLEYFSIHRHFDFVISGSLHSTIFSIKNRTPFATLDFSPPNLVDKKETLLEDFSHLDRHIKISEIGKENVFDKIEKCEMDLDKNKVEKRLKFLRNKGIEYIKELEVLLNEKNV